MDSVKLLPTRRSLLSRLRSWDDQDSWRQFFDSYWQLLFNFALKTGLPEAQAEDAVQETIISVARQMPRFRYDPAVGSFKSWLLQIARRRIADQMRRQYRAGAVGAVTEEEAEVGGCLEQAAAEQGWEAIWEEEWRKRTRELALERVRNRVRPEQFQMFTLAVLKGWPAAKVAQALGVTLTQVYMARHRVGRLVRLEARRLDKEMV
jgi:RNA polymerase sigma-70 factor (ECF subfamily)